MRLLRQFSNKHLGAPKEHRENFKGHAELCSMCKDSDLRGVRGFLSRNKQSIHIAPEEFLAMITAAKADSRRVMKRMVDDNPRLKRVRNSVGSSSVVKRALDSASEFINAEIGQASLQDFLRARPVKPFVMKLKAFACSAGIAGLTLEKYSDSDRVERGAKFLAIYGSAHYGKVLSSIAEKILAVKGVIDEYGFSLSPNALEAILNPKKDLDSLVKSGTLARLVYACEKWRELPPDIAESARGSFILVGLHAADTAGIDLHFELLARKPSKAPSPTYTPPRGTPPKNHELSKFEELLIALIKVHPDIRGSDAAENRARKIAIRLYHEISPERNDDIRPDVLESLCMSVASNPDIGLDAKVSSLQSMISDIRYPMQALLEGRKQAILVPPPSDY